MSNPVAKALAALEREAEALSFEKIVAGLWAFECEVIKLHFCAEGYENPYRLEYTANEKVVRSEWALRQLVERYAAFPEQGNESGAPAAVDAPADEPDDTAAALAAVKRLRAQLNRSFAVVSSARDSLERFLMPDGKAVQIEPSDLELTFTLLDMAGDELGNVEHVRELERQLGGAE